MILAPPPEFQQRPEIGPFYNAKVDDQKFSKLLDFFVEDAHEPPCSKAPFTSLLTPFPALENEGRAKGNCATKSYAHQF